MEPKLIDIGTGVIENASKLIDLDKQPRFQGDETSAVRQINIDEYDNIQNLFPNQNIEAQRANNQEWGQTMLNGVSQLISGTIGEIVSIPGYVASMFEPIEEMDKGISGLFLDAGKTISEAGQEFAPIYQSQLSRDKIFAPWDSEWMAQTVADFGPTIALMVASIASEGMATPAMLGMMSKVPGIAKYAKAAATLKQGSSFYKALRASNATLLSRTAESGMEAYQTFEENYNRLKQENPELSDEEMRKLAGEAGSEVWRKNWGLIALDIIQYQGLLNGFGKFGKLPTLGIETGTEALEEGIQFAFQQEAKEDLDFKLGKTNINLDTIETFFANLGNPEMQKAMVQGALGGAVFQGAGYVMDKISDKYRQPALNSIAGVIKTAHEKGDLPALKKDIETKLSDPDITPPQKEYLKGVQRTAEQFEKAVEAGNSPEVAQSYAKADQHAQVVEKVNNKINETKSSTLIGDNTSKATLFVEATQAPTHIDNLKEQYSGNTKALKILNNLEKKYKKQEEENTYDNVSSDAAKIVPLVKKDIKSKVENEFLQELNLVIGEETSKGKTTTKDKTLEKTQLEIVKQENDIDKLLQLRESENEELAKTAKSRLNILKKEENQERPDVFEDLLDYYKNNPITFQEDKVSIFGKNESYTLDDFQKDASTFNMEYNGSEVKDTFIKYDTVIKQKIENLRLAKLNEQRDLDVKVKQEKIKQRLLSEKGLVVIYKGVTGAFKKEGSKYIIENDTTIYEIDEQDFKDISIIEELKKYNVSIINEKEVNVNGILYAIQIDDKGNITGLSPSNNVYQVITNEAIIVAVEIERNKNSFQEMSTKSPEIIDAEYEEVSNLDENKLLEGIYLNNFTEAVDSGLEKLYNKEELTEKEEFQVDLWVTDLFIKLSKIYSKNPNSEIYKNAYNNAEIVQILLYTKNFEKYEKIANNNKKTDSTKSAQTKEKKIIKKEEQSSIKEIFDLKQESRKQDKIVKEKEQEVLGEPIISEPTESVPKTPEKSGEAEIKPEPTPIASTDEEAVEEEVDDKVEQDPKQNFYDITEQEEQGDLIDTKDSEWTDTNPNRVKTTDALLYTYDDGIFTIPSMGNKKYTEEEFDAKYQKGIRDKGYHVVYDKDGQVVFMEDEPTLDVDFLRNLSQVGNVYNVPVTLEVDKNYTSGNKRWSNSTPLSKEDGWKSLKVAVKIQGKTIGFLADATRVDSDNIVEVSQFEQLRKTIFENTKNSTSNIYTYPVTTTIKSINPPRFWKGPRTTDLLSLKQDKPIILGLVKNGKLFLNNAPLTDVQKEELEGKFNLQDGAVYWMLTNTVTGEYVPYRLFTTKIKDHPEIQSKIRKLFEGITEQNWKEQRNKIQSIVRWKDKISEQYGPDFGYTKTGKFFIVNDGVKNYDVTPAMAYDAYVKENGYNKIDDSPIQVDAGKLNQPDYNETIIKNGYFAATLNAGLFHSPNFRINIEPLVQQTEDTKVVRKRVPRNKPLFSKKDGKEYPAQNVKKSKEWFLEKIGNVPYFQDITVDEANEIFSTLENIHNSDPTNAYGFFLNGAVYIMKNAKVGTTFHEAAHTVFTLALSEKQQKSLLDNVTEEQYKKYLKDYPNIEDAKEEYLANMFSEYVQRAEVNEELLKKSSWYKRLGATLKRLFRKMYLAMKAAVGINLSQEEIFFNIQSGAYKNNKGFKRNVETFKPSIKAYPDNLKQQDRLSQVQRLFKERYLKFKEEKQKEGLTEKQILDRAVKPTLDGTLNTDNIYYQLSQWFMDESLGSKDDGDLYGAAEYEELSRKLYDPEIVGNKIGDSFGPLYFNALDNLKELGIRVTRLQGDFEINDETQDTLENWMEAHPAPAYEALSKQIKIGLGALPRGEFINGEFESEFDDLGFPRFVEPFETYSFIKDALSDSLSVEDYMENLAKLGEDIGWARVLHEILSGQRISSVITDIELFKSQLYQFLQEPEPVFKYLLQTIKDKKKGLYEWRFNNSASKSIATRLAKDWLGQINSPMYNKIVDKGLVEDTKTKLDAYIKNNKDDNAWLYKTINDLGLTLSREAIDNVTSDKTGKRDFLNGLKDVLDNIEKENFDELMAVKTSLINMAKLVKKYYPEFHLPAFTNVEGETVQNYIRNSFMARQLNKFKSAKYRQATIDFYRKDPFYAPNTRTIKDEVNDVQLRDDSYSLWLDRIEKNDAHRKMDFAVLDGQKLAGQTVGTPYADLSPLEFTRVTLNAFYNNGNYKNKTGVGKSFYSAQIMADSGSHAYIGFESYEQEAIINKLVQLAKNEYFAYLHNQVDENKTGIKGYNPKLMFIPGLIENKNNLTPEELQTKAIELVRDEVKLRLAIQKNLNTIVDESIKEFEKVGIITPDGSPHLDYKIKDVNEFVKDFIYNDFFAQTQIISLFHGKLYQYKSMEDFYKRAKEIWSPGNFLDTSRTGVNQTFMSYFVDSDSTVLNYKNNKESIDNIYNNILKAGFSEDDAKKAAAGYGYTDGTIIKEEVNGKMKEFPAIKLSNGKEIKSGDVDSTDAQGIIDIHRWREIMLGKGMEKGEVERIYDAIINDTYTIDDLTMVMNPIKQFYYTLIDVNGQVSGLQIKNSEYVLLPQIAKGNKKLENILKFFDESREKHGVNASINFDSAVKVGIHKLNKSLNEISTDNAIELDNNEYRIQGEVPEHQVDTTNLLGTQLRKLIMGDLELTDIYEVNGKEMTGKELIDEWNALLVADIWESSESLKKEFSDPKQFYYMLQQEATARDYPDKFIEALTLVDGKPRLGLFHPLLTKKSQALVSSIYRNNITKMKFNGMTTPNVAMGSEDLKIVYNKDNSIRYFEAYLPLWSESLVKNMDEVTVEELEKLGLDLGVAYRIPTEGKYSMIPLKVKGFTNAGIVLPAEITKVAGLDYDIDKMFVMLYEFITKRGKIEKVKFEANPLYEAYEKSVLYSQDVKKYLASNNLQPTDFIGTNLVNNLFDEMGGDFLQLKDQYDSIEDLLIEDKKLLSREDWGKLNIYQKNTQKARDNRKLDIIRSVLNNPKTIKSQLTPGGFDDLKAEANRIEDKKDSDLGKINPMSLLSRVKIFSRMMAGKKLIGIPANYNATHALMQHNSLELTQPVLFDGINATNLGLIYIAENNKKIILPIGTSGSGKSTWIKSLPKDKYTVISPDEMRVEFTGNMNDKSKDKEIYEAVKERTIKAVNESKQVIIDSTNLQKERRRDFINTVKSAIPDVSLEYKLLELNPELAKQRIKAQIEKGENRANVPDSTIDRHAVLYKEMLEDIKDEPILPFQENTKLISNNFAQYLASVVDNGKDPLADKYNLNTYTADVAMLLAKFFPIETGMKFIAQPSIVEFYKEYVNAGGNRKAEFVAIEKVLGMSKREYNKKMEKFTLENISSNELENGLTDNNIKSPSQQKMLMHFLYYKNNQAKDLGTLVTAIKVPDAGSSSSLAKTVSNIAKVNEALKLETITGVKTFLTDENLANNSLYEKGILDAMREFVKLGFPDYLSESSSFVAIQEELSELKGSSLSEKEINLVNDALYSFMSSKFAPLRNIDTLKVMEQVPKLWKEFIQLDNKEYYALMGSIDVVPSEYDDKRLKLILNNNQPKDIENKIMNQWENLLHSPKLINSQYTESDLGRMLTQYAFITNGFRFTTGSLSHIQPISYYENLTDGVTDFNTFIEQEIDGANNSPTQLSAFTDQFIRHYFPRLSYVESVEKEDGIRFDEKTKEPYVVILNDFNAKEYVKYRDENRNWFLFKKQSMDESGAAYYERINPLGLYREVEEWNYLLSPKDSIFEQNNMNSTSEKAMERFGEVNVDESDNNISQSEIIQEPIIEPTITPKITLNTEQKQAVDKAITFIKSGNPSEFFVIEGKAGTGKTTIAEQIAKEFIGKNIQVAALSHKAKSVIRDKFINAGLEKGIGYQSVASLLGQTMDLETGKFEVKKDDYSFKEPPIANADIIIIDEASMINEQALELIMEGKRNKAKVLFLGDIGQLPPIRTVQNDYYKNKTELFGKKSPVFDIGNENKSKLIKRVRQGEESPILPYADYFWENSQVSNPVDNPAKERVSKVTPKGSLIFTNTFGNIKDEVLASFEKAVKNNKPNHIKVVTYRNKTRQGINKLVHDTIFGMTADEFNKGELIMFNSNYTIDPEKILENSFETQIIEAGKIKTDSYGVKYQMIEIDAFDTKTEVPVVLGESKKLYQDTISQLFKTAFAQKGTDGYRQALNQAWGYRAKFANIDYAYAITSHKSQGSTYDIVVVDEKDIMSVGPITAKEKSESIYTALTRPRNVAVVISSTKVDETLDQSLESLNTQSDIKPTDEFTQDQIGQSINTMSEFVNHSGGAKGGDTVWDTVGREFGVVNHNHYRPSDYENAINKKELDTQYLETVKFLGRGIIASNSYAGKLVRRDMIQANKSDAIFGVTELIAPGVKGRKGYMNKKSHIVPEGGTGYAVARGILFNKNVYVYNQSSNYGVEQGWYKWSNNNFVKTEIPILTKNFAGIGSQEINESGKQAIREVYENTQKSLPILQSETVKNISSSQGQQLDLFNQFKNNFDTTDC